MSLVARTVLARTEVIRTGGEASTDRLASLKTDLVDLDAALSDAVQSLFKPLVFRTPTYLGFALASLSVAYRRASGLSVTHHDTRDGVFKGEPLSPFGMFAAAFFREVDPNLPAHSLANAIRKYRELLNKPLDPEE